MRIRVHLIQISTSLIVGLTSVSAQAWAPCPGYDTNDPTQSHAFFLSPYTHHWQHSDEHKPVILWGVQRHLPNQRLCGLSLFSNSFGQPSLYAFTGWQWPQPSSKQPRWYASVTAGMLYGYVGEHKDKVPLNVKGFSPAIIPALGWRINDQTALEIHVLGTAALMFGLSRPF